MHHARYRVGPLSLILNLSLNTILSAIILNWPSASPASSPSYDPTTFTLGVLPVLLASLTSGTVTKGMNLTLA